MTRARRPRDWRWKDFTVQDGGKQRPLAFFRFDGASEASVEAPPAAMPGVFTNREAVSGGRPLNVAVLVFDALNDAAAQNTVARAQMMRY